MSAAPPPAEPPPAEPPPAEPLAGSPQHRPRPGEWVAGARPRTLPAALVPVAVGIAVADAEASVVWWRAALALVVSLAIQVGTNYANDYSDGVRGTDEARVGPVRLVAGGLARPAAVRAAAVGAFGVAGACGLALAVAVSPWLVLVGAACIAAGWLYTGGPRPYGYAGYGEVFVFAFFGLVATAGTAYVCAGAFEWASVVAGVPVGLFAVALLVVNNLRDIATDARSGKRTLAVRLGDGPTRLLYLACIFTGAAACAALFPWRPLALVGVAAIVPAIPPLRIVRGGATGRSLVAALVKTGLAQLALGALLVIGLVL
ncbi:MAG TPA: 1,4-dihydroxy-2-naphthoate polyprenyltransferase [Acidimicrobiales bacterium]|nr:1,4-dihydroxy-2-naphthoate polyprenyltransferase [Acidimicrobiales bacterium]